MEEASREILSANVPHAEPYPNFEKPCQVLYRYGIYTCPITVLRIEISVVRIESFKHLPQGYTLYDLEGFHSSHT